MASLLKRMAWGGGVGAGVVGGRCVVPVLALLLLLSLSGWNGGQGGGGGGRGRGGGVSAQLFTAIEDVNEVYKDSGSFPFKEIDGSAKHGNKPRNGTCMAPVLPGKNIDGEIPYVMDDYGLYRGEFQSRYFCANIPHRIKGAYDVWRPWHRLLAPHSTFWYRDPGVWGWHPHHVTPAGDEAPNMDKWIEAKQKGLIFKINVNGIRSRGHFLKGWYHVMVTLDLDHNRENVTDTSEDLGNFRIDKLVISARGRTLVPGRPRTKSEQVPDVVPILRPPRRAWVGGIGEFVQDFPQCEQGNGHPKAHRQVQQQFIPCGTVQYGESKHGSNFYYSYAYRKQDQDKYGHRATSGKEIHANFRLDNSFCNRYYELDFVATGTVRYTDDRGHLPILRSVSTRFIFASSHSHHHPDYYENADPIPRGGGFVDCSQPLQGEWIMKKADGTPPTPNLHRMSVTKGADLVLSWAKPDATFYGALKYVIPAPDLSKNRDKFDEGTGKITDADSSFHARRTWLYSNQMARYASGTSYHNLWRVWRDHYQYPDETYQPGGPFYQRTEEEAHPRIITAVQRVLNEFDWETWVERNQETNFKPSEDCFLPLYKDETIQDDKDNTTSWAVTRSNPNAMVPEAAFWPHPYYDVTCGGVEVNGLRENELPGSYTTRFLWIRYDLKAQGYRHHWLDPNTFEAAMPPITGRCKPSLWYMKGFGSKENAPPMCNEFFWESEQWINFKNKTTKDLHPRAVSDPALERVVLGMLMRNRKSFEDHYLGIERVEKFKLSCDWAIAMREEWPNCPSIPPRPYTPRAPLHKPPTKDEQDWLDWEAKRKYEFRQSPAYRRGMLVSESPYTLFIWDARLIHGFFMTILTMFVTPISLFMARYYKETFMDSRILLNHIWYFIHLFFSFVTQLLFMVGLWRQAKARRLLGVSRGGNSLFHRVWGWMAVGISVIFFFFGGLRTMNRKLRAVTLAIHWAGGWIFYALCLGCMLSCIGIPASPGAYQDFTTSDFTTPLKQEPVFVTVMTWIFFDVIIHCVMTFLQCRNDKKMKLTERRFYFLSPMPVIAETFRFDTPGRFPRIYILCLYVIMSFIATTVIIVCMYNFSPRGRGLGFMTCTHSDEESGYEVYEEWTCD